MIPTQVPQLTNQNYPPLLSQMEFMNRFFSTTRTAATAIVRYTGYNINLLGPDWAGDIDIYAHNGAVKASFIFILDEILT